MDPGEGLGTSSLAPHESRAGNLGITGGRSSLGLPWKELLTDPPYRRAAERALRWTLLPAVITDLLWGRDSGGAGTKAYHILSRL